MKKKFKDLLHRYKVEAFKLSHNEQAADLAEQVAQFTEETLNGAYHYQFRNQNPDPERIETFNRIKNFTLKALLPPVLERVTQRIFILERQHAELVKLVDEILEVLSDDNSTAPGSTTG